MNKDKVRIALQFWRFWAADLLYLTSKNRKLMESDLARTLEEIPYDKVGVGALNYSMLFLKSFRNTFYFRCEDSLLLRNISRCLLKPLDTVEIHGKIGEGFRIYHNYAIVHPHVAGVNFTVRPGVIVGMGKPMKDHPEIVYPIIGDNVCIYANSIVFGGIRIGNNVEIGAGSIVNKDVPDNCIAVGNPCRIIQKAENGEKRA